MLDLTLKKVKKQYDVILIIVMFLYVIHFIIAIFFGNFYKLIGGSPNLAIALSILYITTFIGRYFLNKNHWL